MKFFTILIFILLISPFSYSRQIGETEITAEEGIEVFQNEKYYLLKKNVKIISDNFNLSGDEVKIFFNKDLYDIKSIEAQRNVIFDSNLYKISGSGEKLIFTLDSEKIYISGKNSKLITNEISMESDGIIEVNNKLGDFFIRGSNSSLKTENILIRGNDIDGKFSSASDFNDILFLNVVDDDLAYIKNENTEMFANVINYNKNKSLIELTKNVEISRDGEIITGDYGTLDTKNNSYKVKSDKSTKVKVIISNKNE